MGNLIDKLPKVRGQYREKANLAPTNRFGVGGPAEVLFRPEDTADLAHFIKYKPPFVPITVIGLGSNILVRDGGIDGVVIKLGRGFATIESYDNLLAVGAAALNYNVALFCQNHGLGGVESLVGIPGTIGGSIAMNAGAYKWEIADSCHTIEMIDQDGDIQLLTPDQMGFAYRRHGLKNQVIFTKATLAVSAENPLEIKKKIDKILEQRESTQPTRAKTAGSTFVNPNLMQAWKLIDEAGCRGLTVGDASVSEKHCNFLINNGNATAKDIETLGELIRVKVREKSGINLEWEIKRIGKF